MSNVNILPPPLAGDSHYKALNTLLDRQGSLDLTKLLIYWLDTVDVSALPVLASQFHIMGLEGWAFADTVAKKRALLKKAVELHRYKGTPWAVRQAIRNIDPTLDIEEWQSYGGQPFRFRLTDASVTLSFAQAVQLHHTIEATKSLRSRLDGAITGVETHNHQHTLRSGVLMSVRIEPQVQRRSDNCSLVKVATYTRIEAYPMESNPSPYIQPTQLVYPTYTRIEVS